MSQADGSLITSLCLAILILRTFLNDRDLCCGQVEEHVDAGTQLSLYADNGLGTLLMFDAVCLGNTLHRQASVM